MILVDTSIWAGHIDREVRPLSMLLEAGEVLAHPLVIGEIAMGNLRQRHLVLQQFQKLPQAVMGTDREVLELIERNRLFGTGLSYVDAHLLSAARLTPDAALWSYDKQLQAAAEKLGVAHVPSA